MTRTNRKTQTTTRSHRFGALTRRLTLGKARAFGKFTAKVARGAKAVGSEIADGFAEEGKK